ncbi:MAG: hypothetical protein HOJ31_10290 [Anaerolineae bacterium]|jgi:hypothetical protein|nr:hypothetical protein [Anaerolineae bacterium]
MTISKFRDIHKGKTILLVGNGSNLSLTPPENFDFPTIGMNTIHLYEGWSPDYFVTVDRRVMREFGEAIEKKFRDIPKFVPAPRLNQWHGENFYRFKNANTGFLWPKNRRSLWQDDIENEAIIYGNVMHVAIKLAYYMGAKKIIIIGMEHEPHRSNAKFWGEDKGMSIDQPTKFWQEGYRILSEVLQSKGVELLNISQDTFVPDSIIKTASWKRFINKPKKKVKKEQDND